VIPLGAAALGADAAQGATAPSCEVPLGAFALVARTDDPAAMRSVNAEAEQSPIQWDTALCRRRHDQRQSRSDHRAPPYRSRAEYGAAPLGKSTACAVRNSGSNVTPSGPKRPGLATKPIEF